MVTVTFELPEDALSSVRKDPDYFAQELRLAAAVKWYEMGRFPKARRLRLRDYPAVSSLRHWAGLRFQHSNTVWTK